MVIATFAMLAFVFGVAAWLLNYLGGSTLYLIIRLALQGSIRVEGLSLLPVVRARRLRVVQPPRLGSHTVITTDAIVTDASLWHMLTCKPFEMVVTNPWLDWTGTVDGDSHLLALLKDVGYVKEVTAKGKGADATPKKGAVTEAESEDFEVVERRWSAEVRAFTARILLRNGTMQMSKDFGMVLGDNLRIKALVGLASIEADAKATHAASYSDHWHERSKWPPASAETGRPKYPLALAAASDNLVFEMAGWRTTTGLLLRKPILASLQLTPSVADFALGKLSPLLHCAVGLEEGDSITATLSPLQMHLPADSYAVRLEPMKLVVATRGLLHGIIALLNKRPNVKPTRLEAWTTALQADIAKTGSIESKRLDLIMGTDAQNGKGIHLCCWGRVDPGKGSAVDMTIGLPKPSLLPLGLGDLPDDYVLTIPVRGNSQQPDVDFGRAGNKLTELFMRQKITEGLPFMKGLFGGGKQKGSDAFNQEPIPAADRPFPWEKAESKESAEQEEQLSEKLKAVAAGQHAAEL